MLVSDKVLCEIEYIEEWIDECAVFKIGKRTEQLTMSQCAEVKWSEMIKIEVEQSKLLTLCKSVIADNSSKHNELTSKIAEAEKNAELWKEERTKAEEDNKKYREVLAFIETSPSQETGHIQNVYMQNEVVVLE